MARTEIEMVPLGQADLGFVRVGEEAWNNWTPKGVAPIITPLNALARRQINAILDPKTNLTITERLKGLYDDHWEQFLAVSVLGSVLYSAGRTWIVFSSPNEDWGRFGVKLTATAVAGLAGALIGAVVSCNALMGIETVIEKLENLENSLRRRFS